MLTPLPMMKIGACAERLGVLFIIDNTVTPYITQPFKLGAHIVVHSTSKYICGHGTHIGGAIVDSGRFPWSKHAYRYPLMVDPDPSHGNIKWLDAANQLSDGYGASAYLLKMRNTLMRDFGPCPSPFASFMFIQGIETLALRVPRHCENADVIARFLDSHPAVRTVSYPKLGNAQVQNLAAQNMGEFGGPLVSFELSGGLKAGKGFIESLRLAYHVSNIGDARTLATHPASTTHASLTKEARMAAGVTEGAIRLSVGIENIDDIITDLTQALDKITGAS